MKDMGDFVEDLLEKLNLHSRELKLIRKQLEIVLIKNKIVDLTPTSLIILIHIHKHPSLPKQVLDSEYFLGKSTFYNLEKLTKNGYIIKEDCLYDKRSCLYRTTSKGADIIKQIEQSFTES